MLDVRPDGHGRAWRLSTTDAAADGWAGGVEVGVAGTVDLTAQWRIYADGHGGLFVTAILDGSTGVVQHIDAAGRPLFGLDSWRCDSGRTFSQRTTYARP